MINTDSSLMQPRDGLNAAALQAAMCSGGISAEDRESASMMF
jgi:hypothetical protein